MLFRLAMKPTYEHETVSTTACMNNALQRQDRLSTYPTCIALLEDGLEVRHYWHRHSYRLGIQLGL